MESYAMTYNLDHFVQHGMPMSELAVFNPANEYEPFEERAKSNRTLLIPQKIHIVWVDGAEKIPPPKRKIMELNQEMYPEYEYKIWSIRNVTRDKFRNYDRIHNIYNMEGTSRYSKKATIADMMRYEILENEGGWFLDTNFMLRTYKLALSTERTFRHRWSQSMCVTGAMPGFSGIKRRNGFNSTNHWNIFLSDALEIAGNHDARWLVRGM
jgi:mannosyltransferase OCH1-like enzyme